MLKRNKQLGDYRGDSRLVSSKKIITSNPFIKKQSEVGKNRTEKYNILKEEYMNEHPTCEMEGCNSIEREIHHKGGRVGDNLYKNFMCVCRLHHTYIHDNPKESYEKGWLLKT